MRRMVLQIRGASNDARIRLRRAPRPQHSSVLHAVASKLAELPAFAAVSLAVGLAVTVAPPLPAGGQFVEGKCHGSIIALPRVGYQGERQKVLVTIRRPSARIIARVVTDNPACRDCEAAAWGHGRFVFNGEFIGEGPFAITFKAFDRNGKLRCEGSTPELKALGPKS